MKKFLLIFLFALVFSIAYVSGAPSLDVPSSINLGDTSRNKAVITTFTITNNGDINLTNITPITNAAENFKASFNPAGFNLIIGESKTISLNATIPSNSAVGNMTIGNIYLKSNEYASPNFPLKATIKGGLEITDLDVALVLIDASSTTATDIINEEKLDFGDDYDVRPGSTLQFDFSMENLFLDEEETEIRDVSVLVTIKEIDDGEDIDEKSDSFDIKPEEKEDISVTLKIPLKVKEGSYDVEILAKGKDEEGVEHKVEWNLEMEVKKESHDIYIETLYLTKDKLSCSRISSLKTKIFNLGNRDEDEVKIEAKNPNIGLDFVQKDISLVEDPYDENNGYEKTIPIIVDENVKAGTYPISFNVYIKNSVLLKNKNVDLAIEDCKTGEEIAEEEAKEEKNESIALGEKLEEEKEEATIPILGQEITAAEKTTATKEKGFSAKTIIYLSLFGTTGIIAFVIVIGLLFRHAPKRKKRENLKK